MASDPPQPRLCQIAKVDNFDGFGFNLHAEKNKPGQFIGKIDGGSPAEVAGLKEGDRNGECHLIILQHQSDNSDKAYFGCWEADQPISTIWGKT